MTLPRRVRERNLCSRQPLRSLLLTPVHHQVRLLDQRETTPTGDVVFSDESRFQLCLNTTADVSGDCQGSVGIQL
ncbi:hypothetical protein TNCV_392881 [Trichonephila clavipes]|nr:hypothetical protein TNCV_392881 [Trichonephila clavipes]